MIAQIVLIVCLLATLAYMLRTKPNARQVAIGRITLVLAVLVGIVVILAPGWLSAVAEFFGIGRGADLLLYGLIIAFLINSISMYKKNIELSRELTRLARAQALTQVDLIERINSKNSR